MSHQPLEQGQQGHQGEGPQSRIIQGPNPDRFYCPFPGCNRSFAELWRLKVHYRAPPDIRGSGKERGHGTELKYCPKCGKELKAGKHHVGCTAGKSAPRQAAKRQRQMSTNSDTEMDWQTEDTVPETDNSVSWHQAVKRQVQRVHVHQQQSSDSEGKSNPRPKTGDGCRIERLHQNMPMSDVGDLVFTNDTIADFGLILQPPVFGDAQPAVFETRAVVSRPVREAALRGMQNRHELEKNLGDDSASLVGGGEGEAASAAAGGFEPLLINTTHAGLHDTSASDLLRVPSPPPLPDDWDIGGPLGTLFDFDQFDLSKRSSVAPTQGPVVTITNSMKPSEISNPSDDYIWQILFASENDPVPKRVTAHLHHPQSRQFDEPDSLLDGLPWPTDNQRPPTIPEEPQQQQEAPQQQQQQQPEREQVDAIPPPPAELLQGEAKTVTVTYVMEPGPGGKMSYTVQQVAPVAPAPSGGNKSNGGGGPHTNGTS